MAPEEPAGVETRPELVVPRPDEATALDEVAMARGWLTHLREGAVYKLEGLDDDQLRWRPAPTANSLGEIVVHLGYCERLWVRAIFAGEEMDLGWRARMFELPEGWGVADVVAFYRAEVAASDAVLDGVATFDVPAANPRRPTTLRWIVDHLIEELARHLGHMDITRELLDGQTGR